MKLAAIVLCFAISNVFAQKAIETDEDQVTTADEYNYLTKGLKRVGAYAEISSLIMATSIASAPRN